MKFAALALALGVLSFVGLVTGSPAMADDNAKWVAQCMKDNADAKVPEAVVNKYCVCMNEKMDDNETRTITQWGKSQSAGPQGLREGRRLGVILSPLTAEDVRTEKWPASELRPANSLPMGNQAVVIDSLFEMNAMVYAPNQRHSATAA